MSAFNVVNHFIKRYDQVTGYTTVLRAQQKLALQTRFRRLKDAWCFDSQDVIALIDFMYLHNPLKLESKREYGSITTLDDVAYEFKAWTHSHSALISRVGLHKAVKTGMSIEDAEMFDMLDEMVGA